MATMARMTTTSRAAAITTALTGLRPKMVDCGALPERGDAATSSPDALGRLLSLLVSGNVFGDGFGVTGAWLGAGAGLTAGGLLEVC
jgi:hypothetical protein